MFRVHRDQLQWVYGDVVYPFSNDYRVPMFDEISILGYTWREWRQRKMTPRGDDLVLLDHRYITWELETEGRDGWVLQLHQRGRESTRLGTLTRPQLRQMLLSYQECSYYPTLLVSQTVTDRHLDRPGAYLDHCTVRAPGSQLRTLYLSECQVRELPQTRILIVRWETSYQIRCRTWKAEHILHWKDLRESPCFDERTTLQAPWVILKTSAREDDLEMLIIRAEVLQLELFDLHEMMVDDRPRLPASWEVQRLIIEDEVWYPTEEGWTRGGGGTLRSEHRVDHPDLRYHGQPRYRLQACQVQHWTPPPEGTRVLASSSRWRVCRRSTRDE